MQIGNSLTDFHVGQRVYQITDRGVGYDWYSSLGPAHYWFAWDENGHRLYDGVAWPKINAVGTVISDKFKARPRGYGGGVVADHYVVFFDHSNTTRIVRACYLATEPFEGCMKDFLGDKESEVEVVVGSK
jgi:hypothetical protein